VLRLPHGLSQAHSTDEFFESRIGMERSHIGETRNEASVARAVCKNLPQRWIVFVQLGEPTERFVVIANLGTLAERLRPRQPYSRGQSRPPNRGIRAADATAQSIDSLRLPARA